MRKITQISTHQAHFRLLLNHPLNSTPKTYQAYQGSRWNRWWCCNMQSKNCSWSHPWCILVGKAPLYTQSRGGVKTKMSIHSMISLEWKEHSVSLICFGHGYIVMQEIKAKINLWVFLFSNFCGSYADNLCKKAPPQSRKSLKTICSK